MNLALENEVESCVEEVQTQKSRGVELFRICTGIRGKEFGGSSGSSRENV